MAEESWLDDEVEDELPEEDLPAEEEAPAPLSAEEITQLRARADVVQRFNTDPAYARNVLLERARQLGLQVVEERPRETSAPPTTPPPEYIESVKQGLAPELQFLAPQIATATWAATQTAIAPLQQQQRQQEDRQRQDSFDAMARALAEEAPEWKSYEDEMLSILEFMRGALTNQGAMTHPKYGSALKLLYKLASGDAQATANAGRRMQQALRNGTRTSAGGNGRTAGPDLQAMIGKAKTSQDKWGLAFRAALREHGVTN